MSEFLKNQRKTDVGDLKKKKVFNCLFPSLKIYIKRIRHIFCTDSLNRMTFLGGLPGLYWCFLLCVVQKKHLSQYRYLSPIINCTHCFPLMVCSQVRFTKRDKTALKDRFISASSIKSSHFLHAIRQYSVLFVFLNAKPQFGMSQHVNLSLNLLDQENLFLCCSDWNTSEHQSWLFLH